MFTARVLSDALAWKWLDRIIGTVDDGWHLWEVPDADIVQASEWYCQAGRHRALLRELLEASVRRDAWMTSRQVHAVLVVVDTSSAPPCVLDPERAARALGEPLYVLMEDRDSDGAFLDAVLDILGGQDLGDLRRCMPPPLRYDSPGGNGKLIKLVNSYLDDPAWKGTPRRFVVVTDSDARQAGARSADAARIADVCRARGISCHVLHKRSIENYLPQEVLDAWVAEPIHTSKRGVIAALGRLSPEQRDHFPIKKKKGLDTEPDDTTRSSLYGGLPAVDKALLAKLRLDDMASLFRTRRTEMTAAALRNRAGIGADGRCELDEVIALICATL